MAKAREVFEPFITQLGYRLSHVLRRLLPPALFLLQVGPKAVGLQRARLARGPALLLPVPIVSHGSP